MTHTPSPRGIGALRLALGASLLAPALSFATPASGSPYFTDPSNEYVQDVTSDGLSNVNMVLCIMNAMSPADMLSNKGVLNTSTGLTEVQYVALIDKNKCDSRSRASASNSSGAASGSTSTPDYMTAIVDVSRGSGASDPMVGKIWMTFAENGGTNHVSVRLSATTAPATLPPYGQLRLDYVGYSGSNLQFNGFIDTNGGAVSHVETGQNSSNVKLALVALDANTGSGVIESTLNNGGSPQVVDYTFAYSADAFARKVSSGSDICFDRSKANASRSVWRYGVYDASSGARVDQQNPGFPLTATAGSSVPGVNAGQKVFGFASYWGVNFGGVAPAYLPGLPDGQISAFSAISDGRPNHSTSYALYKNSGKLIQWTQHTATLGGISGIPFSFFGEGCSLSNGGNGVGSNNSPQGHSCVAGVGGALAQPDYQNWVMQWQSGSTPSNGGFQVVGMQSCSSNGCLNTTFPTPVAVLQQFRQMPINAWSDALGSLTIAPPPGDSIQSGGPNQHADSDPVYYYTQSTVLPSSASTLNLYCLSNCPTSASLAAAASNSSASPFASPTNQQWSSGTTQVHYTFDGNGLHDSTNSSVIAGAIANPAWQNGVNSGRLFTADLGSNCNTTYCEPSGPSVYYTYQTGANQWSQTMWLTAGGSTVNFDPPQAAAFTVPSGAAYGSWAGKQIQLQFNGFGNLNGIPGNCVDPQSNLPVGCTPSTRYVPAFALADGTQLTLGSQQVLTRALDSELRLATLTCPVGLSTSSVSASLPTTLPHDPTQPNDVSYIGAAPVLTSAPSVIDGVLQ